LEAVVKELQARLGLHSGNSSLPPSKNPPQAAKPVVKTPTGRKPGGQPGHQPCARVRLPRERLKEVVAFVPKVCAGCTAALPAEAGPADPEPTWHQVAELPSMLAEVVEYQGHGRQCQHCGTLTWERIPAEIRAHAFGPRLTATVSYLSGSPHVSKRGIEELVETLVGIPIALGTVVNLEQEMSKALTAAHQEAQEAVCQAAVKNVDETGWKQAGKGCWLWAAATSAVAYFVIHPKRGAAGLKALLGEHIKGIIGSDRWAVYGRLQTHLRQICWAHLKRDFQKLVDRGPPAKEIGEQCLAIAGLVFDVWHTYRGGGISRRQMQKEMAEWRDALRDELEQGCACADAKAAALCRNLLAIEPALWTFVSTPNVEPTNNHIERILRSAVLWRKNAFGCHSANGCRFVERILTAVQTLRLQNKPVLEFLHQTLVASRNQQSAPKLVPCG
jgi:transposase